MKEAELEKNIQPVSPPVENIVESTGVKKFIGHTKYKWRCPLVGFTKDLFGHGIKIGTPVYYFDAGDLFVFENKITFHRATLLPYLTINEGVKFKEPSGPSKAYEAEEQMNFHIDQ